MTDAVRAATWLTELARLRRLLGSPGEAAIVLEEAAGRTMAELAGTLDAGLAPDEARRLDRLVEGRLAGVPLQYLVGRWPFRHLELTVDRRALIPRPETEELVGVALGELERLRSVADRAGALRALDLGTGSGAIAFALADEADDLEVLAVDRSDEALRLAAENAGCLPEPVRRRVRLARFDWHADAPGRLGHRFDLVVANPPYLSAAEWRALDPEVRAHEPAGALLAGATGLEDIARVLELAPGLCRSQAAVVIEIGWRQGADARALASRAGASFVEVLPDLAGHDRVLVARLAPGR